MLIHEVGLLLRHRSPALVEHLALGVGTARTNNLDVGILGADGCHKRLKALVVEVVPLLVADTDVLHVEWLRVAHLSTDLTPLGVGRAVGKLDQVETVLDIGLQLVVGHVGILGLPVLELAGHTDVEHWQGFCTDILGELEELEETEAIALEVVGIETVWEGVFPAVLIQRTVLYRADGVLPLIAGS